MKKVELEKRIAELEEQIEKLNGINIRLSEELDKRNQEGWLARLDDATAVIQDLLKRQFGYSVRNLQFEHVDASGYWFTFELAQDSRRQTWAVRHYEVTGR